MNSDLEKLLDLQSKDLELLDVDTRMLEVADQLGVLDAELQKARDVVAAAERAVADTRQKRDELESKIEMHRKHQERRREKLGFLHSPKDVQNVMAEIDLATSVMAQEEDEWVRSADQLKVLELRVNEAREACQAVEQSQAEARSALQAKEAELEAERSAALNRREASATDITKPLLLQYDRLRNSKGAPVVVALDGAACGACYTTVPLNRRTQMRGGAVIEFCESCGVILYSSE